jgi:uncharacterized protein (DUF1697 family)
MSTTSLVALLRGVNVGGKRSLPMAALREVCEEIGWTGVRTWIQSGNVVFRAPSAPTATLEQALQDALMARCSLDVPVVVRTAEELAQAVANNPFLPETDPELLHVGFLQGWPTAAAVASLDPERSPPDEFAVVGRELYLKLPNGMARTKLTSAWLDRRLGTVVTARNWRSVLALAELVSA